MRTPSEANLSCNSVTQTAEQTVFFVFRAGCKVQGITVAQAFTIAKL
jgi:hypothetical protein